MITGSAVGNSKGRLTLDAIKSENVLHQINDIKCKSYQLQIYIMLP